MRTGSSNTPPEWNGKADVRYVLARIVG